ncbi:MAG TPA: ABC transporter substrate-binding protein [Candidatus Angelobacter sp.]|nr:ABC transporter substrate-binding protein [Candidatus Angelobacter sp.]
MTAMRVIRTLLFAVALAFAAAPAGADDANPAASAFMQSLGSKAINELTDPAVPQSDRQARFRTLLDEHFDMPAIAKFTLGRYWRTATDEQRTEFRKLFEDFLVQSYSTRFSEYHGEGFVVAGSTTDDGGTIVAHSKIDMPSSEDIRVDWHLRATDGGFVIVDIVVEGVSMAVTQRSEFASVIQSRGGVAGLLDALRAKNAQSADSTGGTQ